jgi:hypothetical protein
MKKFVLLFSFIFLFSSFTITAQDYAKKGVFELGGLVMYANNTVVAGGETDFDIGGGQTTDVSISFFFANVPLSYFVIDGLQIGIIPEFVSVGLDASGLNADATLSVLGIYFATAYNFNLKSSVYPFIQGRFGYNSINISSNTDPNTLLKTSQETTLDETLSGIGWGFSGGIKVQLGKAGLLSFGAGYQQRTANPDPNEGDLRNGLNVITVQAGFSVFLGK